ncbi:hypothetical protein [Fibrella forsythiae]|uniref:DUF1353 domain-containing protein n=1 Tax=Fibrella forsythiae TaxID=2817061 RepID=A0ABS3JJY2_9BACT|nr:hypothetical protein [Fibrella forsythiae]MBO0950317.1 hypothetical protein [Fibrella forsythiae]
MTATEPLTVQQALTQFYNDHDFGAEGGIDKPFAYAKVGPVRFPIPNTAQRKEIIWLHDLHHLLNGYETTWKGEGQVSAWELATGGFGWRVYIWALVLLAMSVGILVYPVGTFRAFVRGTYCQPIMGLGLPKADLMALPVASLRRKVGIDETAVNRVRPAHYIRFGLLWLLYVGSLIGLGLGGYMLLSW